MSIEQVTRINPLQYDAVMAGVEKYAETDKEQVLWLYGYFNGCLAQNKAALCRDLGYREDDWEQIRALFTGRVAASIKDDVFEAIAALRRRLSKQRPLIRTVVVERIIEALDYCRDNSAMIYVAGPTGRGKTYTSQWWAAENNHGRTKYLRTPSDCTRKGLAVMLARTCGTAASGSMIEIEANIRRALTPRNIIIVDEAGYLLSKSGKPGGAIELFRDLHDMCGCGIALIFTDVYLAEIKRGRNADYFEQFLGRLEYPVEIPKIPRRDEVRQILQSYFGRIDEAFVERILKLTSERDGKLRTLFKDLIRAEQIAKDSGHALCPKDLQLAIAWRKSAGAWPEDK